MEERNAEHELERAEGYLQTNILPTWRAWPEHYREASDSLGWTLEKFLDPEQAEEVREFISTTEDAGASFLLRVGFQLGRLYGSFGELTDIDVCRAVDAAGGNPGRALVEKVDQHLAEVVQ